MSSCLMIISLTYILFRLGGGSLPCSVGQVYTIIWVTFLAFEYLSATTLYIGDK